MDRKQKGQATLEYLLLFLVSVFLTGGLLFQFNDAFRNFINGYFGAYLACLLESGELPSLGWDAGNSPDDSCNAEFQPFNLASGRQPLPTSGVGAWSGGSSGGTSAGHSARASGKDKNGDDGEGEAPPVSLATSESASASGGAGARIPGGKFETFGDREGKPHVGLNHDESKEFGGGSAATGGDLVANVMRNKRDSGRETYVPIVGEEAEALAKKTKAKIPATETDIARDVRRVPAGDLKKKKTVETEEPSLTFPDFLKYLIIFGIVTALVLLLGGQAVQIAKSKEK
jgi:hypothetical protein